MTDALLQIGFKFPDWKGRLKKHAQQLNLFAAAQIQTNRGLLFDSEGRHNGRDGWEPLAFRNGQVLSRYGTLRKSIAPYNSKGKPGDGGFVKFSGDTITIGTNLLYARMMNWGTTKMPDGVLRPTRAKALMIPLPPGKWANEETRADLIESGSVRRIKKRTPEGNKKRMDVIFRKSVRIPARRFDDWNEQDQAEFDAALMNEIIRVLNGKN